MNKTVLDLISDRVRSLAMYVPGKLLRQSQSESGLATIKLASNENPFGPSPLAMEAIRAAAKDVNLYPDNDASELRAALALRHRLSPKNIFIADGSLGILDVLARTLLAPGLNCVTSQHSFISYALVTRAAGADLVATPLFRDTYDLDAIAAAINSATRVVIVANPNNPTGTMFDADAFDNFLRRVPDHVLVVLDEAYYDFAQYFAAQRGITYTRSIEHIRAGHPNLVVLRTFSKAQGLAGLRLGYACGQPELLQYFARLRNAFSVSVVAEAAGLAALRDNAHVRRTVENNAHGAAWLLEQFAEVAYRALPTSANFIYFEVDEDADVFAQRIEAEGVIVRSLVPWGIANGIRVTVGTPEQNEIFFNALKKIAAKAVGR